MPVYAERQIINYFYIFMKTIFLKIIAIVSALLLAIVATGCSLVLTAAGGGFGNTGAYSGWKSVRYGGDKYLICPYAENEFYLRGFDCYLWGSIDNPLRIMIGNLLFRCKEFPHFSVYQGGQTELFDVRDEAERNYEVAGFRVCLKLQYEAFKRALITIIRPDGDRRNFSMPLAAEPVLADQP